MQIMKNNRHLVFTVLVFISSIYLTSFSTGNKEAIHLIIRKNYHHRLDSLSDILDQTQNAAQLLKNGYSLGELRARYIECRIGYKKIEYLAEYLDAQFVKDYLNGPPLLHLERNNPNPEIRVPEGLQILDELIFSDDAIKNRQVIVNKLNYLITKFSDFKRSQQGVPVSNRQIFEASRMELVRVFTLGITGFDTPGSGNALPEARAVLLTLHSDISPYLQKLKDEKKSDHANRLFIGAINYLHDNKDFNSFDRYHFLVSYINPLFGILLEIQRDLNIETIYEVIPGKHSLNYNSTDIFDSGFLNPFYYTSFNESAYTPEVVKLGKTLFFDPVLSANNKRSCASCHQPEKAFTDGKEKSIGFDLNTQVNRNSPTLINSVFASRFFHDMRADRLENQVEHVMTNEKEFNSSFNEAGKKITKSSEYVAMFKEAFPWFDKDPVTEETIKLALAAYVQSLIALDSEFDLAVRGEKQIDNQVKEGFNLFMGKAGCGTCHFAPTFTGLVPPLYIENESEILGVLAKFDTIHPVVDPDMGRFHNKRLEENSEIYMRSFKTPTVRNIKLTAPYMHNGSFSTLDEVMAFYNKGGGAGLGLEVYNQTLPPEPLKLTSEETARIISFMHALTDTSGVNGIPAKLPGFEGDSVLINRKTGGEY